ncbi:hypothetical protein ACLESD_27115, partial [Pyxidicoccus sp. 3LFB2]
RARSQGPGHPGERFPGYTAGARAAPRLTLARVLGPPAREPERAQALAEAARATGAQGDSVSHRALRTGAEAVLAPGRAHSALSAP